MGAGHRFGEENSHGPTQYWVFMKSKEDSARCSVIQVDWIPSSSVPRRDSRVVIKWSITRDLSQERGHDLLCQGHVD